MQNCGSEKLATSCFLPSFLQKRVRSLGCTDKLMYKKLSQTIHSPVFKAKLVQVDYFFNLSIGQFILLINVTQLFNFKLYVTSEM